MAANALVALGKGPQGQQWAERALAIRPDDPMLLDGTAFLTLLMLYFGVTSFLRARKISRS